MPFAAILTANKALPYSSSMAVTRNTFHYLSHAHVLYQWQWP